VSLSFPRSGSAALVLILLATLGAPWLAPGSPDLQEDVAGARCLPPLTRAHAIRIEPHRTRIVTSLVRTPQGWEYVRAGRFERIAEDRLLAPPSPRFYLLGTDSLGRDMASRLLHGLRHSVGITALSVALALLLGIGVGSAAGLAGGWWDAVLMRGVDVLMSIPRLLLFLLCATLFEPSTLLLVLVLGATTWTGLARVVRAQMMRLRQSDLALAARASGFAPPRVLVRHLIPQIGPVIVVTASLRFADTMLLESALAFLGLGTPPPAVSLGGIIASGRDVLAEAWWIIAWPGILISTIVLAVRSALGGLFRIPDPPSLA
jgi:peptide/nickel transport system permease protein